MGDKSGKSGKKDKTTLLETLGADFFKLLGGVSIARSRRQIKQFYAILTNFAPRAHGQANSTNEIDLLIATDCISEGQNLQDCDTVLNYDIHWNPVRIIQRFGRIDRIGSRNQSVRMIECGHRKTCYRSLSLIAMTSKQLGRAF